jgi:S-DNA-T family DNA segregation ATPase FtsK/SpoIIIE
VVRLEIDVAGLRREVDLVRTAPSATLADLVEAAGGQAPNGGLWVDGERHDGAGLAAETLLLEGSSITAERCDRPQPLEGWTATVAGGLDAGRVLPLPAGRIFTVGRAPTADISTGSPSVSWTHLAIGREGQQIRVRDCGSTNGAFADGRKVPAEGALIAEEAAVRAGGLTLLLRRDLGEDLAPKPGSLHNLTAAATAPFNRPPRPGRRPSPGAVAPPERKSVQTAQKFSLIPLLAPLVMAVAMVIIMGNPRYAILAGLSPIMGVATWFEQKRRRKKEAAAEEIRFANALETFRMDLEKAATTERARQRDRLPDPATILRWGALPTTRLWQRRAGAPDFLTLHAGIGDIAWNAPGARRNSGKLAEAVQPVVAAARVPAAPVEVDLANAGVVGLVGQRQGTLAVARSLLVQAAIHSGPADLTIGVFCDAGRDDQWDWTVWLPQTRRLGQGAGDRWSSGEASRSQSLLRDLQDGLASHPTPAVLLVIDSDFLTEGRESPARALLGQGRADPGASFAQRDRRQVSGIVLAASREQLPASCTVVIEVDEDAAGSVSRPGDLAKVDDVTVAGLSLETARRAALDLARFDDPELVIPGTALPGLVRLPPLLGLDEITPAAIRRLWSQSSGVSTPVGVGENGVFCLDIVRDGPHGLVGGTTGSGKSEFLLALIAGLAARNDPTRLAFVIFDFKGEGILGPGKQFPHTVGTVSNIDKDPVDKDKVDVRVARRALQALKAEMAYRQEIFAQAGPGINNLDAYMATRPAQPLPRLLLVIDEFAQLAKQSPEVLTELVSVGAVGRTLGVHMILATQSPKGVVKEDIRANTNLRIALRVQSRDDSVDIIGTPAAAAIRNEQKGRAYVRLGLDDITPVQTAYTGGRAEQAGPDLVELLPVVFGASPKAARAAAGTTSSATDLELLIAAVREAQRSAGFAPPRPIWPEPLGPRVDLTGFQATAAEPPETDGQAAAIPAVGGSDGNLVWFALSDDPASQRQIPAGWDRDRGNLLLIGIARSGASTALASLALALALAWAPDRLDLFILDMGASALAPLAGLPHVVDYIGAAEPERQTRLLKHVRKELDRRQAKPGDYPQMVILIDGFAALKDEYSNFKKHLDGQDLLDDFYRVYADGPAVGIWCALTVMRPGDLPLKLSGLTTQKWVFQLADQNDYGAVARGLEAPAPTPGRCVLAETGLQTHVATCPLPLTDAVAMAAAHWDDQPAKSSPVLPLPGRVSVAELGAVALTGPEPWRLPVGLRESDQEAAFIELYENEHLLIAGPVRSGKSSLLLALAESLRSGAAGPAPQIWGLSQKRSPLTAARLDRPVSIGETKLQELLDAVQTYKDPLVLLIDDAEQFADPHKTLVNLIAANQSNLHVIAAGRADDLRAYNAPNWTKAVRKARCGVLLQPNIDLDNELLGVVLPRNTPVELTPGRGYVCASGSVSLVQCVSPSDGSETP